MSKNVSDVVTIGPNIGTATIVEFEPGESSEKVKEVEWRNFEAEGGRLYGGVWFGKPAKTIIDDMPFSEFCYVKSGRVRVTDQTAASRDYGVGEGFFMPRGFTGAWEVIEDTELAYVILTDAAD